MSQVTKVYPATAWNDQDTIRSALEEIDRQGLGSTARWTDLALGGKPYGDASLGNREFALMDIDDLKAADGVLLIPNREMGTGHHIEFGYALALEKPIVTVGRGWTIFHSLAPSLPSIREALIVLDRWVAGERLLGREGDT